MLYLLLMNRSMNQKCQQKKKEEEEAKAQAQAEPQAQIGDAATAEETSVTVPLVEEPQKALSMKAFITLGITAAIFDIFYAPCTAMGNSGEIPLSPYVSSSLSSNIGYFPGGQSRFLRDCIPFHLVSSLCMCNV